MRHRPILALLVVFSLSGCELVASFDRNKIPPPTYMRPDASFIPKPADDIDAGPLDASVGDASVSEGGVLDGALLDGAIGDGGARDAAADAAIVDAGP